MRAARKARVRMIILNFTMGFLHNRLPREHHSEEYQNSHSSDIHQNLSYTHEWGIQEYVKRCNSCKGSEQVKSAVHYILGLDRKSRQKHYDCSYDQEAQELYDKSDVVSQESVKDRPGPG